MGNLFTKRDLFDDLIQFKMTSKQLKRSSKKCEKNQEVANRKMLAALKSNDKQRVRIHAQNVIDEKNQALNFLRFASRIDAVASRLESSVRITEINKAMGQTVHSMSACLKNMQPDQVANTMADFEKAFEDMDVAAKNMEGSMEASTSMSTNADEVDNLIAMVAKQHSLDTAMILDDAGTVGTKIPESAAAADSSTVPQNPENALEARLAKLRS
jgi:charged multivesicular body protein 1